MGGIYDSLFTDEQVEVRKEVLFINAAKKKIPELLCKYNSVHTEIGRRREEN